MAHDKHHPQKRDHDARRDQASKNDVVHRVLSSAESNPLAILVGGLAVGALAGALVPRSAREKELLAPLGRELGNRARTAFDAARTAGMEELSNRGLTKDGVRDQARGLLDGVTKAVSTAGSAAVQSAKHAN